METVIHQQLKTILPKQHGISFSTVEGGYINRSYCIESGSKKVFCKTNSASKFPQLLRKEKNSLEFISKHGIIKTPGVIDHFEVAGYQVLMLEWINQGERTKSFWKKFGEQLAALHLISNEHFGREEDNYMGSIPQNNQPASNWIGFFVHQRLEPLVTKCREQKLLKKKHLSKFEKLYRIINNVYDHQEKPALLHGDLWKGNFLCDDKSKPVLIDPSVYFGHRSIDLGMTTFYNSFDPQFYEAYKYHFPLPSNYKEQWEISNLYALLISLLLFGKSLLPPIDLTLKRFT